MQHRVHLEPRAFPDLLDLEGIPENTMHEHHQNYLRSVTRANDLFDGVAVAYREATLSTTAIQELRESLTELPMALASVKSYELFFAQLGGSTRQPPVGLAEQIRKDFGSHDAFRKAFMTTALASQGWVALVFDLDVRRLLWLLGETPEQLSVWNLAPVIVMEVSERSARSEFGQDRVRYIQMLLDQLDWSVVERNLDEALGRQPAGPPT